MRRDGESREGSVMKGSVLSHCAIGLIVLALVASGLPGVVRATTYEIKSYEQVGSASTFSDLFDDGAEPPSGPSGPASYVTWGTFLPGDESGGVLKLVTGQGTVDPGDDRRAIGAGVAVPPTAFFSLGTSGSVTGVFRNLAPLPEEAYTIGIVAMSDLVDDEAVLFVFNSGGVYIAVFRDEGPGSLGTFPLTGLLTGAGEVGLKLALDASGMVTASIDTGSGFVPFGGSTSLQALGAGTHSGGFEASEPVPEPATLLLLGSALTGLGAWACRRRGRA